MTTLHFEKTLTKLNMSALLKEKGHVIVGFSGGADSTALLVLLAKWGKEHGVTVTAAHVNHGIRGEEADRDEAFCRAFCEENEIPFEACRLDVPALAKANKTGLEETARRERYRFFDELSEKLTGMRTGAVIATAHNASDNLETVQMNLMRGAGLNGMAGIEPVRDGRIIRPLLYDSGDAIRSWCRENGLSYVVDSTNAVNFCTRNKVRNRLVPVMREIADNPEEKVAAMTVLLRRDDDCLKRLALAAITKPNAVPRDTLANLDDAIASRVLRELYRRVKTAGDTLTDSQIDRVLLLVREKNGFSRYSLPGGITVSVDRDLVTVEKTGENGSDDELCLDLTEAKTYENELMRLTLSDSLSELTEQKEKNENIYKLSILRSFESATIKGHIIIRKKLDGDAYMTAGITHKVKRLFTDRKLTEREKNVMPILSDEEGILWIPTFGTRDGTRGNDIHILAQIK